MTSDNRLGELVKVRPLSGPASKEAGGRVSGRRRCGVASRLIDDR